MIWLLNVELTLPLQALPPADLRRDDSQLLDDARRNLPQVRDLHGGLEAQVQVEDFHHSGAEGISDLERNGYRVSGLLQDK